MRNEDIRVLVACEFSGVVRDAFRARGFDAAAPFLPSNTGGARRGQKHRRGVVQGGKAASRTFKGIASAMADQWGDYVKAALTKSQRIAA